MPPSRFNLGKYGPLVNVTALVFLSTFWFFQFFPVTPDPTPAGMNWSCVLWSAILIFMMIYYALRARHVYAGPIAFIRKDE